MADLALLLSSITSCKCFPNFHFVLPSVASLPFCKARHMTQREYYEEYSCEVRGMIQKDQWRRCGEPTSQMVFLEQVQCSRSYDRLCAILDTQFAEDVAGMPLDSVDGNDQRLGDLLVGGAGCH